MREAKIVWAIKKEHWTTTDCIMESWLKNRRSKIKGVEQYLVSSSTIMSHTLDVI